MCHCVLQRARDSQQQLDGLWGRRAHLILLTHNLTDRLPRSLVCWRLPPLPAMYYGQQTFDSHEAIRQRPAELSLIRMTDACETLASLARLSNKELQHLPSVPKQPRGRYERGDGPPMVSSTAEMDKVPNGRPCATAQPWPFTSPMSFGRSWAHEVRASVLGGT